MEVGELTLAWARSGSHVGVFWIDEKDFVTLTAPTADLLIEALEGWLGDEDVAAPSDFQEVEGVPAALAEGPPVADIPDGYTALVMDGFAFMRSDFADAITIHEERAIEALGAAIIVRNETVVGTVVAGRGYDESLGRWPQQVRGADSGGLGDVPAEGFSAGGVDALLVGYDEEDVETFMSAWEESLTNE